MAKLYYERNLPHFQPVGATFFLTYRLHGSLPIAFLRQLRQDFEEAEKAIQEEYLGAALQSKIYALQKRYYRKYDAALDKADFGPTYLAKKEVATVVKDSLHYLDGKDFTLYAYSIMSNHVHVVFKHHEDAPMLDRILQNHKSYSAWLINKTLGRKGQFWQRETYDHQVRDEAEFQRILQYVIDNPLKAGLVNDWDKWPFTFIRADLLFK